MSEAATLPDDPSSPTPANRPASQLALCVIWAPSEGRLVGSYLLPLRTHSVFGRAAPGEGSTPRLLLAWMRPGLVHRPEPPTNGKLSRNQLQLRLTPQRTLEVENVGLCPLLHNGQEVRRCEVSAGDTLVLGQQMAFLCIERLLPPRQPLPLADFPFGGADASGIVGESEAAWTLRRDILFAAPRAEHVLIQGPSGSGKELVAGALHAQSSRGSRPLVARNAATIPDTLIDAELFGNAKNYPNPGMAERPGLVGQAHQSTLFLDEFAELPLASQAHLLRVLDGGDYQRLGEAASRTSDFRLIAATNRPLSALKEDVAARFLLRLRVPDLNERREDIPLLARALLRRIAARDPDAVLHFFPDRNPEAEPRLSRELVLALVQRGYTTHVRELLALLWESLRQSASDTLQPPPSSDPSDLSDPPDDDEDPGGHDEPTSLKPERIQQVLDEQNGSIEKSWRLLGLPSRYVLRRLIQKFGIEVRKRTSSKPR